MSTSDEPKAVEYYLNDRNYVTREQWGAKAPTKDRETKTPIPYVVFTYTQSMFCETKRRCIEIVYQLQASAMVSCQCSDIKSNFLIGGDGRIYEGRGWTSTPEHYYGPLGKLAPLNRKCIEVAFINRKNEIPTKEQADAAATLIKEGIARNILTKDVKVTTLYKEHTIPKAVRNIENVRVSKYVTSSNTDPYEGWVVP